MCGAPLSSWNITPHPTNGHLRLLTIFFFSESMFILISHYPFST